MVNQQPVSMRRRMTHQRPTAHRVTTWLAASLCAISLVGTAACSSSDDDAKSSSTTTPTTEAVTVSAGAASASILPTVDGKRDFLDDAPGWPDDGVDPYDPGAFVVEWDQGRVDIDNGSDDSAWVHDDLRSTAVALERGDERVVMVSTDTYMQLAPDADEIERRAHEKLPKEWADAPILIAATHLHHGPVTAFGVNEDWYDMMADATAGAVVDAVAALTPAEVSVATGEHRYGVRDARDPLIVDPRLNIMAIDDADSGDPIATIVQWASHPETTLGWEPPTEATHLDEVCPAKGWANDDCFAEGRYMTADYPGVLRTRLADRVGGEVLYFNGAIGVQIGPGDAPTWMVDNDHPVTDDGEPPAGAEPLTTCEDRDEYMCRSFAKTESIGDALADAVIELRDEAKPYSPTELTVRREEFKTRLTNIGFRVLLAEGDLGWKPPTVFTCDGPPINDECTKVPHATEDDPVITPLADSQILSGDVGASRITDLSLGSVGFMFMPGELPPELVIGLPDDFTTNVDGYYDEPELHATGADYTIPGNLLSLVDYDVTFTIGLGTDELGYFVPISDYRLKCLDIALPAGAHCADLFERGVIEGADFIGGETCSRITHDPDELAALGHDGPAVAAICRYGQGLGAEIAEPDGHYEETNAAGWDVVTDLWAAAQRLYGS